MLQRLTLGGGRVDIEDEHARLWLPATPGHSYALAQLDDYHGQARNQFPNQPPLRVTLHARASRPQPFGTLGFGFWNEPFSAGGEVVAVPQCLWFFYASAESDVTLTADIPGHGWKAAIWKAGIAAREAVPPDVTLTDWHKYELEWQAEAAVLRVDDVEQLRAAPPPGPLGFVMWMDNQVVTFRGGTFSLGLGELQEEQWLEVKSLKIERSG